MRAMHGAFRRDGARLDDGETAGWDNFRVQLDPPQRVVEHGLAARGYVDARSAPFGTHLPRPHRRLGRALAMSSRLAARPTTYRRGSDGGAAT
jgi:hypothetical protein